MKLFHGLLAGAVLMLAAPAVAQDDCDRACLIKLADDYAAALHDAQLPPDFIVLIKYLLTEVLDGRNQSIADGVTRALGRPARDFSDFARAAAAAGAWDGGR